MTPQRPQNSTSILIQSRDREAWLCCVGGWRRMGNLQASRAFPEVSGKEGVLTKDNVPESAQSSLVQPPEWSADFS